MIFPSAPAGVEPAAEALPDADPDALPEPPPHALSESTITPAATAERIRFAFFMFPVYFFQNLLYRLLLESRVQWITKLG